MLAYPAARFAVADGKQDYAFVYLNLRMANGRSDATKKRAGDAILAGATAHFSSLMQTRLIGITAQVDESPGQVFDGRTQQSASTVPEVLTMLDSSTIQQLAAELDQSKRSRVQVEHFSKRHPGMTIEDGSPSRAPGWP